ncbi:MAG: aminoacyl-tRNA hydrolase [bacterium]
MFNLHKTQKPGLIIFGLGNPGKKYVHTRHNAGFLFLSAFANKLGCELKKKQFNSVTCYSKEHRIMLVEPLTYMNMSGVAVKSIINKYSVKPQDIVVVHDDMDLPVGRAKFQYNRSSAGHKGIESIIEQIGTKEFYRIRIGIGKPASLDQTVNYVLSEFGIEELKILNALFNEVSEKLMLFINGEREKAMEYVNKITLHNLDYKEKNKGNVDL